MLFGHEDGEELVAGDPGVRDASAKAAPRLRFWRTDLGIVDNLYNRMWFRGFFRAKAQRSGAIGGDAYGCR